MNDEHDILDHRPGRYYVSVRDGARHGYLLGPYDTHQEALDNVDRGNQLACQADGRAHWYAFGTCRLADGTSTVASVFGT
jgi:hypothetical protein